MKSFKKLIALTLSTLLILGTTACSDKSWAIKIDDQTLSTGIYHYFLFEAYQQAVDKLSTDGNVVKDLNGQKIEDQDATTWVKDTAVDSCKKMMATEKLFRDYGLSLTEDENKEAQENTDSIWENSGSSLNDKYGIDKDSFHQAYSIYPLEIEKLYNNIYGSDSSNQVSDEEILNFYNENYINVLTYSKVPYDGTSEDDGVDHSNDTDEKISEQFNSYVDMINSGTITIDGLSQLIKQTDSFDSDPFVNQPINKNSSDLPTQIKDIITNLEVGKATCTKFNEVYFLFYKQDNANVPLDLSNAEEREKILYDMNSTKFESLINDTKNDMKFTLNEAVLNDVNLSNFAQ